MARPQERLPRLNIIQPLHMQQPHALFSPALPSGIQQGFHPSSYAMNTHPLQTPMQPFFAAQPPPAPGRPGHQSRASFAHMGPPGMQPPNGFVTPITGHFPRPSMMLAPGPPFPGPPNAGHRPHKRQMSIGGPPKAVLGGPARKLSPNPAAAAATAPPLKKKITIKLPKETIQDEEGNPPTHPEWARKPIPSEDVEEKEVPPVELCSKELYPAENWKYELPDSIDVFLPGKDRWDTLKQQVIEAKLERLGVERGSGSSVPHIFAPHARAASISSPADPALLLFKLNKLQQSQNQSSAGNSLAPSPQPNGSIFGLSPSPHQRRPSPGASIFQNRHGYTMSLAQPPTYTQPGVYDPRTSIFNPFGSNVVSVDESIASEQGDAVSTTSDGGSHAPFVPVGLGPLPLSAISRPDSRPDFARGFGLEIPEEEEPEEEEQQRAGGDQEGEDSGNTGDTEEDGDQTQDMNIDGDAATSVNGGTTAPHSRFHSRHVSRLSAALSLRSVGGNFGAILGEDDGHIRQSTPPRRPSVRGAFEQSSGGNGEDLEDVAAVQEWTGSEEEGYLGTETSDDESLGEFSNPSDEERARQQRVERRMRRRAAKEQRDVMQLEDQPRRIPNFPRPPENTLIFVPTQREPLPEDIISNPSEENLAIGARSHSHHHPHYHTVSAVGGDFFASGSRSPLLPPLPHSRVASEYSVHDPAMAHSRAPSDAPSYASHQQQQQQLHNQQQASNGRRESLNPFAKPFVFGKPLEELWQPQSSTPPNAPFMSHTRLPSLGKPLNVAAPEFRPKGLPGSVEFTFRQPDAPPMPQPPPGFPQPEPAPAVHVGEPESEASPAFRTQGREKRPRLGSSESIEEGDSMVSFRFPPQIDSPQSLRHRPSQSGPRLSHRLNPSAEPFTFEAFSNVARFPEVIRADNPEPPEDSTNTTSNDTTDTMKSPMKGDKNDDNREEDKMQEFIFPPSASKPRRAPIPLDFKHPVSSNTVPAGLFKALVGNGDDRTRRTVRSRLSSRELYEHMNRPSMDDLNVQMISRSIRLSTDPVKRSSSTGDDDVFNISARHQRRRSSLPDALRDDLSSPSRSPSVHPRDLTSRLEMQHMSDIVVQVLDDKFSSLRRELVAIVGERDQQQNTSQNGLTPASEAMIADVVSLFRTQLQESASRSLEDSQMDARGEMDFQLVRDIIDEGHKEILAVVKQQFHDILMEQQQVSAVLAAPFESRSVKDAVAPIVESVGDRTIRAVVEAISELSARQTAIDRATPARERDLLLDEMVTMLTPMLNGLRSEPVDYEFLTNQLAQAVKPHISQLIDLASDKRETAGLIMERLLPLMPSLNNNTETIAQRLAAEVRRAIAAIDPFEIKEQVADLVVERLDSRLAVRDKTFNADTVTSKVTEGVSHLLENLHQVPLTLEGFFASQDKVRAEQHLDANSRHDKILTTVSEIPTQLESKFQALHTSQSEVVNRVQEAIASASKADTTSAETKVLLEALVAENKALLQRNAELLASQQAISTQVGTLPEVLSSNLANLKNGIAELIVSRDIPKRDIDELRKLNSDYQIQLTKARAAHGQVRVEKDVLGEKLTGMEAERDRFRNKVAELEAAAKAKATEATTLEARTAELEDALAKALARLQSSDVATQADQQRIAGLEKAATEATTESQALKSKVDSLEMQVTFANRDKESLSQTLENLRKQHEVLVSQQNRWDDLRQAAEKIDMLTTLIGQADNDELQDLRRYRDRTKPLEGDYAVLQKRVKEIETKLANSDRVATTTRQSLAQAQQRSSEWEARAKEYESQLELTRTRLDQAEQTQNQLDADYTLLKIQYEEREADDRLTKDRESKLRDQISALETKVVHLQNELLKAKTGKAPASRTPSMAAHSPSPYRNITNGSTHPPRPDSRSSVSTVNGRSGPPDRRVSSYSPAANGGGQSPQPSVWDSMHAPSARIPSEYSSRQSTAASIHTPSGRYPHLGPSTPKVRRPTQMQQARANAPSPSPSIVSTAPTQGDDGWWQ